MGGTACRVVAAGVNPNLSSMAFANADMILFSKPYDFNTFYMVIVIDGIHLSIVTSFPRDVGLVR